MRALVLALAFAQQDGGVATIYAHHVETVTCRATLSDGGVLMPETTFLGRLCPAPLRETLRQTHCLGAEKIDFRAQLKLGDGGWSSGIGATVRCGEQ